MVMTGGRSPIVLYNGTDDLKPPIGSIAHANDADMCDWPDWQLHAAYAVVPQVRLFKDSWSYDAEAQESGERRPNSHLLVRVFFQNDLDVSCCQAFIVSKRAVTVEMQCGEPNVWRQDV